MMRDGYREPTQAKHRQVYQFWYNSRLDSEASLVNSHKTQPELM